MLVLLIIAVVLVRGGIIAALLVLGGLVWWSSGPRFARGHRVSRPDVMDPAVQQRLRGDSTHGNIGSV